MSKQKLEKKYKCRLMPHKREKVISVQDAMQKAGWEITAFNLPAAWQFSQGDGVKIAVLDSGCDLDHPDLVDNLLPGYNFLKPKALPEDDCGHGSHCCGIIAAQNNDIGIVGVAPKAKIIPVKVLDSKGNGSLLNVAKGIRWASDQGVDFIVMSLGSPSPLQEVRKAIQYAATKGVIVFCAAGNAGQTKDIFYPAAYPETIAIGAIDEKFDRAKFSCTGENLDFLAPGVQILSTVPDNWYEVMSGSSMACPFVAGVAALVLSYVRTKKIKIELKDAKDYIELLKKYTIPTNNTEFAGKHFFEGFGIIDPRKLEAWAAQQSPAEI